MCKIDSVCETRIFNQFFDVCVICREMCKNNMQYTANVLLVDSTDCVGVTNPTVVWV